jgi:predicted permease
MGLFRSFSAGIRALFHKDQRSLEMDEELRDYLEASAADKMRDGLTYTEALRAARVEMGSTEAVKQKIRSAGWESTAESLWQDVRYGLRMMAKSPGFTAVAIVSLALGIGANTAIFTLINGLVLTSLPVRDPHQLLAFGQEFGGGQMDGISPGPLDIFTYEFYQRLEKNQAQRPELFEGITAYSSFPVQASVRLSSLGSGNSGAATQAMTHLVSGNFFSVLGAEPLLGRSFTPEDAASPGSKPVAVVSYRYWQQALSGDAGVLGRALTINGTPFTIIGVMPPKFFGVDPNADPPDVWLPLTMQAEVMLQPSLLGPHALYWLHLMARRHADTNVAQAQAWVTSQLQQYITDREGPQLTAERKLEIPKIYIELLPGDHGVSTMRMVYQNPLMVLMGVVVLVLLIACANLANFLLAKTASREREISTRLALGSTRGRIVRQILTETLLLSFFGAALGLLLAFFGTRLLIDFLVGNPAHTALSARPDMHVLAFTFGISILTALLFGVGPALRVSRMNVAPVLTSNARTAAGAGGRSSRLLPKVLVTVQVMLSLILLAGAGMFLRTLANLQKQDVGFNRQSVLLINFNPKFAGYKPAQLNALYTRMLDRMNALPGVRGSALSEAPPIGFGSWNSPIRVRGYTPAPHENISTLIHRVSSGYFETLGVPLRAGRGIEPADTATSQKVVVVNQTLADHFFPHGGAIGHTFTIDDPGVKGEWQIVGVVKDAKYRDLHIQKDSMIYLPVVQLTGDDNYAYWLQLRTEGDPAKLTAEVRSAFAEIDPNLSILEVRTISEQVSQMMGQETLISQLSSFFSLLAHALACIGLYGVMTYNVLRRTNEIGIRLALGAQTGRVMWMVLRESLLLLGIGVVLGLGATLAAGHAIRSMLFELSPSDPITLAAAVFVITGVVVLAAWFPARRATRVDPMVALRYE